MPSEDKLAKKKAYVAKLAKYFEEYQKLLIVTADNVGSSLLQKIRQSVRPMAQVVMGKNTMMRRAIRQASQNDERLKTLIPKIVANVGFVFTKHELTDVGEKLQELKVGAPAKVGAISPVTVTIPKGPTGLEPTKTSFLQALNIASKINKGQIEILNDKVLIEVGEKVGPSEATLLKMLNIKPFKYGLNVKYVYDNGDCYDAEVLKITDDIILSKFALGVSNIASISLQIGYPTLCAVPHAILNAYKKILAVAVATSYTFPEAELIKEMAENPEAYAAAAAPAAAEEEKPEEPEEEEEEEEDLGGGGLFGGDSDDSDF